MRPPGSTSSLVPSLAAGVSPPARPTNPRPLTAVSSAALGRRSGRRPGGRRGNRRIRNPHPFVGRHYAVALEHVPPVRILDDPGLRRRRRGIGLVSIGRRRRVDRRGRGGDGGRPGGRGGGGGKGGWREKKSRESGGHGVAHHDERGEDSASEPTHHSPAR